MAMIRRPMVSALLTIFFAAGVGFCLLAAFSLECTGSAVVIAAISGSPWRRGGSAFDMIGRLDGKMTRRVASPDFSAGKAQKNEGPCSPKQGPSILG